MTKADRRWLAELCGWKLGKGGLQPRGETEPRYYLKGNKEMAIARWHPDESIEQAMMVAEAIIKQDIASKFELGLRKSTGNWEANFLWLKTPLNDCVEEHSDTPAAAICAAALAALAAEKLPKR